MMGTIPNDVRSGLLDLFYGVYEKDPDRCYCKGHAGYVCGSW